MAKDGTKNLVPLDKRTKEKQKEITRKGGIASGEARRRKKELRECLEILLEKDITARNGETMSGAEAIALKQFEKALKGDTKAFEVVRDTAGQKPIERVITSDIDENTLNEVSEMVAHMEKMKREDK